LCHYFDLIAGTSTGAIIAASLALGLGVEEVIGHYQRLGRAVFAKDWFRQGIVRARYDEKSARRAVETDTR
jgi:patatin-like phospholipase/acyl hydrolase